MWIELFVLIVLFLVSTSAGVFLGWRFKKNAMVADRAGNGDYFRSPTFCVATLAL